MENFSVKNACVGQKMNHTCNSYGEILHSKYKCGLSFDPQMYSLLRLHVGRKECTRQSRFLAVREKGKLYARLYVCPCVTIFRK